MTDSAANLAVPRRRNRRRKVSLSDLLILLVLWVGALTMLVPFAWMVSTSLKPLEDVFKWPPLLMSSHPLWSNYRDIFDAVPLGRFFLNTALVSLARTAGVLATSALAGYVFSRMYFPGRDLIFLLYLGTMMVPDQVTLIPSFVIIRELHWLDTYQALIVPAIFSPFGVFLMRQFFLTIPRDLMEAAKLDGANHWHILWGIMIPLSTASLVTLGLFTLMGAWNDFLWPLIVINSPDKQMLSVGLSYFQDLYFTNWPLLMAASVLAMLPILIIYFLAQRFFVEGIAVTGLKG
jgi:multiple sugar transport system permease protein